eukprot:363698-Chlamydomonas_euryale.AAC.2
MGSWYGVKTQVARARTHLWQPHAQRCGCACARGAAGGCGCTNGSAKQAQPRIMSFDICWIACPALKAPPCQACPALQAPPIPSMPRPASAPQPGMTSPASAPQPGMPHPASAPSARHAPSPATAMVLLRHSSMLYSLVSRAPLGPAAMLRPPTHTSARLPCSALQRAPQPGSNAPTQCSITMVDSAVQLCAPAGRAVA